MMKMGFELPKAFQMETRRLLWLIGLVFVTILLLQFVEMPKGNARWSRGETSREEASSFLLGNTTSPSYANTSNSSSGSFERRDSSFILDDAERSLPPKNDTLESNSSITETQKEDISLLSGQNGNFSSGVAVPSITPAPVLLSQTETTSTSSDHSSYPFNVTAEANTSSANNDLTVSPLVHVPGKKPKSDKMPPKEEVLTLAEMNELLIQSHLSPDSMVPRWSTKADQGLALAKSEIKKASPSNIDGLYAPLYRNASEFHRSYELMEQMLKVYIYTEGERPIFHSPALQGIYASEGWFMKLLEESKHFVTKTPSEAHLFYLPFSSLMLEETLYVPNSHRHRNLIQHLKSYVDMISRKYPFWNRTYGADHFLVACHDWAPSETKRPMGNCIRALCNADVKEGFKFGKDVSLPETNVRNVRNPTRDRIKGKPPSKRKTLAFFAGGMHGYLRPILLDHWGNKKSTTTNNNNNLDMQIFNRLPHSKGDRNYIEYMKRSKYCICPRGYEVNSPRVVEAILYECVPVIISDNFVPPLFETLNWESFAVFVKEKDIPNLKNILVSIPMEKYVRMHMMVKKVQKHFLWHTKPVKYDLFHMILHSIWYNRVFQFRPR